MHKYFAKTLFLGKQVVFLPTCHSTNDIAAQMARQNLLQEGAFVYTHHQTAGRGQRGNQWEASAGQNITGSLFLKPHFLPVAEQFRLTQIISCGIAQLLRQKYDLPAEIKWPNDIYVHGRKICGILIENTLKKQNLENAIVGIGLNVNQESFSNAGATSIRLMTKNTQQIEDVIENLLLSMELLYMKAKKGNWDLILSYYLDNLMWRNERHLFYNVAEEKDFEGVITGVAKTGHLQIETENQGKEFAFKEIQFLE